jgi:hypothetical protein
MLAVSLAGCGTLSNDLPLCKPAQLVEDGSSLVVTCWVQGPIDIVRIGAEPLLGPYARSNFIAAVDQFGPAARTLRFDAGGLSQTVEGWHGTLSSRGEVRGHHVLGLRVQPGAADRAALPAAELALLVGALSAAYPAATQVEVTVLSTSSDVQGAMLKLELANGKVVGVDWSERVD